MTKEIRIRLSDKVHMDLKKKASTAKRTLQAQAALEIEMGVKESVK